MRENFKAANAEALASYNGERAARYAALKLAGLEDAPVQLAVFAEPDPGQGAKLGRRTMMTPTINLSRFRIWGIPA